MITNILYVYCWNGKIMGIIGTITIESLSYDIVWKKLHVFLFFFKVLIVIHWFFNVCELLLLFFMCLNEFAHVCICVRVPQTPLPDQEGPTAGSMSTFELMSSKDLAYQMTMFDWELFSCVHEVSHMRLHTKKQLQASNRRLWSVTSVYNVAKSLVLNFEMKTKKV